MSLPKWDGSRFGKPIASILGAGDRCPELAPKAGDAEAGGKLDALAGQSPPPPLLMSGLYLYFDHLEPAHKIAQDIDNASGSYWHGIMHRREPDDENSAYWFRKAGDHPVLKALAAAAQSHLEKSGDKALESEILKNRSWDPFAFIKACSEARRGGGADRARLLGELQLIEWRLLFDYCFDLGSQKPKRS